MSRAAGNSAFCRLQAGDRRSPCPRRSPLPIGKITRSGEQEIAGIHFTLGDIAQRQFIAAHASIP